MTPNTGPTWRNLTGLEIDRTEYLMQNYPVLSKKNAAVPDSLDGKPTLRGHR